MATKKKAVTAKKVNFKVFVGRFDSDIKPVIVAKTATVAEAFNKAGISLGAEDVINDLNARKIAPSAHVKDSETYVLTANYSNGQ